MKKFKIQVLWLVVLLCNTVAMQGMMVTKTKKFKSPTQTVRLQQLKGLKKQKFSKSSIRSSEKSVSEPTTQTWKEWFRSWFEPSTYEEGYEEEKLEPEQSYMEEDYSSPFEGPQRRSYSTRAGGGWRSYVELDKEYEHLDKLINYLDKLENALAPEHYTEDMKQEIERMVNENFPIVTPIDPEQAVEVAACVYAFADSALSMLYAKSDLETKKFLQRILWHIFYNYRAIEEELPPILFNLLKKYPFTKDVDQKIEDFLKQKNQKQQQEWKEQWWREFHGYYQGQQQNGAQFGMGSFDTVKNKLTQLLGISATATKEEIKDAYYDFQKRAHPDVTRDPNDPMSLKLKNEINPAWDDYTNALKRAK